MNKVLFAILLSGWTTSAWATGAYFAASGGMANTRFDTVANGMEDDVTHPLSFGGALGYAINKYVAVEAAYFNLGRLTYVRSTAPQVRRGIESAALSVSAVGMYPVGRQFSVLGKLGIARSTSKTSLEWCSSCGVLPPESVNTGLSYGLGFQYDATDAIGIRFSLDIYRLGESNDPGANKVSLGTASVGSVAVLCRF